MSVYHDAPSAFFRHFYAWFGPGGDTGQYVPGQIVENFVRADLKGNVSSTGTWKPIHIPKLATWVMLVVIGSAGGGGAGAGGNGSTGASGGGGGGSGAIARLLIPARFLPATLFCLAGLGGAGAVSGTGSAGQHSYISDSNTSSLTDVVLLSGTAVARAGTNSGGGLGETAPTAAQSGGYQSFGEWTAAGGCSGATPGNSSGTSASAIIWGSTGTGIIVTGGGAGGGASSGGSTTGTGSTINDPFGRVVVNNNYLGINGCDGFTVWTPFIQGWGAGGGSGSNAAPGQGGNGGLGSGGGGGGGAAASANGGNGNSGGDGLCYVGYW